MYDAVKSTWPILIAVVLMAYANIVLKLRIVTLARESSVSWLSYLLSMILIHGLGRRSLPLVLLITLRHNIAATRTQRGGAYVRPRFCRSASGSVLILGEHLPPLRIVGLVLIFIGVILVGLTA